MESARLASDSDLQRVAELWQAARAELGDQRGGATLVAGTPDPFGLDPRRLLVVGCLDQVVVGFAAVNAQREPGLASVEVLYVEPGARSVGVGEAMMDRVIDWSVAHGCRGVDAFALPGSRAAKAFFEDNGFVARLLTMHRPLGNERA